MNNINIQEEDHKNTLQDDQSVGPSNKRSTEIQLSTDERKLPRSQRKKLYYQKKVEYQKQHRKEKKQNSKRHLDADPNRLSKKQRLEEIEERCNEAMKSGQKIVVDLSLEDLMTNKELSKLCQQLCRFYGINRRSNLPFHLYFTGFDSSTMFYQLCQTKNQGFENYKVTFLEDHYTEAFNKDEIIYLTPDSKTALQTLSKDKVYVIGGLTDEHFLKGLTLEKAQKRGIETARLPIPEYLCADETQVNKTVLSIVQVLEILLIYNECNDWFKALKEVMPKRFGFIAKRPQSDTLTETSNNQSDDNDS